MKILRRQSYRPRITIDEEAANLMHQLGAEYATLAQYWLSSNIVPWKIARQAYELACQIHTLAETIHELSQQRAKNEVTEASPKKIISYI